MMLNLFAYAVFLSLFGVWCAVFGGIRYKNSQPLVLFIADSFYGLVLATVITVAVAANASHLPRFLTQ